MKKVVIVGAGIAGLAAGIYARQSGFEAVIYEAHVIPGGVSTSWRRKGYLFEGGMHWLTGSSPNTALNQLWHETGALDDSTPIYNRDPFFIFEHDGKRVCLFRDIDKLKAHLTEISPEDEGEIKTLCKDVSKYKKMSMPITDLKGLKVKNKMSFPVSSMISMLPAVTRMSFYGGQTSDEYAKRYKSPLLQKMFANMIGKENCATGLVFTLATLTGGDGGYPKGGSLGMAERIAEKFLSLGGEIRYQTPVERVIIKNGAAAGIIAEGKEIGADAVIVTQDTLAAVDKLFEKPLDEPWVRTMREQTKPILNTFIGLGIKAKLLDIPENIEFSVAEPFYCADQKVDDIEINNYAAFDDYAPEGCSAMTCIISGDSYDWWKKQKENGCYEAEKEKLADAFIGALAQKYPQTKGKVQVWDIATPLTYERYTHSYKGSWMTIMGKNAKMTSYPTKPETINNLYFAGQRLMPPGGLPVAVETGRKAVQYLCLDTDTVFQGCTE